MRLSIIIPCYNESKNLPELIAGYRTALGGRTDAEIILVDNGSVDDTARVLEAELKDPRNSAFQACMSPSIKVMGTAFCRG